MTDRADFCSLMRNRERGGSNPKFSFTWPERFQETAREAAYDSRQSLSEWVRDTLFTRLESEGRLPADG